MYIHDTVKQLHYYTCTVSPDILAGIIFGGLLEKGRKLQLVDINLAVTVRSPHLLRELVQYWRI